MARVPYRRFGGVHISVRVTVGKNGIQLAGV